MNDITHKIGLWYDEHRRDLPWRHTRDAYRIWLSEIILQQTRVAQGLGYYERFVAAFPRVDDLAAAPLDRVLKLWQGLGYYSRARNLHAAARQVTAWREEHPEKSFPDRYADLIGLKGVGHYTAAAIASFASEEAVAVVDGNVYRVLSRLFDIDTPIDTGKGRKTFQSLADELLRDAIGQGDGRASRHNQAMMEFGALHCTPTQPKCATCPVGMHCLALSAGTVGERPTKQGRTSVRERRFIYIIYIYKDKLWAHQRGAGDIWQGLWEFVLLEGEDLPSALQERATLLLERKHQLTHQTIHASFHVVRLPDDEEPTKNAAIQSLANDYRAFTWMEWQQLAVPRLIDEANKRLSAWF
ncbi:MAG: A/G-specific adenine glycosylase [Bacteroidales bacterium]|nr:A/G-specific adenine glycosylase [Bacteroidales bacterium]